jgi:hypothetical protein
MIPCRDPSVLTDDMKARIGMAVNAALCSAKVPSHIAVATIRKNISGNLILTMSARTSASELTQHLDTINQAAQSVHMSLEPPRLNEKWYKLVVHGIPTDRYADTEDGMCLLKEEIERSNKYVTLAQLPRYMSHPDMHLNKAASSVVITVRIPEELAALKRNKVTVLLEPRRVTEF